jgi:hypothetical protein
VSAGRGRWLGAPLLGLAVLACGEAERPRGSLMLAIATDMYVDKDLSRVDILVQPEVGQAQTTQVNLFPALEGRYLPGTFSIIEGSDPGEFVRVRLIARQADRVRVVREAALKIPRERTALLSMPLQWLCDGHVRQDDQQIRSDCEDGYTCVSGACQLDEVDEASLPDYVAADVFGGGNATGGGECFDTLPCFTDSQQPALDLASCVLATPPSPDLNVAAVLPPGGDGHCTSSACWIPLDASALTGWSAAPSGSGVQLPLGLCERVRAGSASVRTSHACPSKSPSTPTCGPWSLVGTEPGDETPGGPAVAAANTLPAALDTSASALAQRVATACGRVAGQSPPSAPTAAELTSLCQIASTAMAPMAPLTWYHLPARCWTDHDRQLSCERACSSNCDPGTVNGRCEASSLASLCTGGCGSRLCLGSKESPTTCTGACDGNLTGQCDGNCLGHCEGTCAAPTSDGRCDGACNGTCSGLCLGRTVDGRCEGRCDGDPNLGTPTCGDGVLCLSNCSQGASAQRCASLLGTSPCEPSGCLSDCGAIGRVDLNCEPATAWLLPPTGMDPGLAATIEQALADLISIRDAESPPALDEAHRHMDRLSASPTSSPAGFAQAEAAITMLTAVSTAATSLLNAVGPARLGPGSGPPPVPPANSCDLVRATGSPGLVDDFEDGNSTVLPNDGRNGTWHVGWDGTGEISMMDPPVPVDGGNGGGKALHLSGSGQTSWGANLNLELRTGAAPYDASAYRSGLVFSAKGSGRLRVIVMQQNLAPGHPCSTCNTSSGECGQLYSTEVFLSDLWNSFILPWSSLVAPTQISTPFAPDQLMTIQFEMQGPDPIDLWLDNVALSP